MEYKNIKPMELYIANVPYDDLQKKKTRPALIVTEIDNKIYVYKITSKYDNKSESIKNIYFKISEYQNAGLKKQSYVDTHRIYRIKYDDLKQIDPIGKLTPNDEDLFSKFLENKTI